jgi:enhancing lycopene biosynthesis protein 2
MHKKLEGKFRMTPRAESWAAQEFSDCNVFYVDSAVWIAGAICGCSRNRLVEAVRVGSLHARDYSDYFGNDGRDAYINYGGRGGAKRLAFHVDSIEAWAREHLAITFAHRLENTSRLNRTRFMTTCGGGSAVL